MGSGYDIYMERAKQVEKIMARLTAKFGESIAEDIRELVDHMVQNALDNREGEEW
jgi:hypothetical protein